MKSEHFPKLLVATEFAPNAAGGGPAVIRQMLSHWPSERLLWWSCGPDRDKLFGQNVAQHRIAHLPGRLRPLRRFTQPKAWLLENVWTPLAVRNLKQTLQDCQPDAVWVIPHDWAIPPLAAVLPESGTAFHVTVQDYVDVHGHTAAFGRARCARMAAQADLLYSTATSRDATSHPMVADLEQRTGQAAAQMLHKGLEQEDFDWLEWKKAKPAPEIRIAHAGTILVESEFSHFVSVLEQLRPKLTSPVRLDLFGAHSYANRSWFNPEWMTEHGNLGENELLYELRQCTWGFSPMSLTDDDPRYNRFSFPTKFITYLAAGLPVITLGHAESSVAKMAAQYRVGLLETTSDARALSAKLQEEMSVPVPWERYGSELIRCAANEFDATKMRARLYSCFENCASATGELRSERMRR